MARQARPRARPGRAAGSPLAAASVQTGARSLSARRRDVLSSEALLAELARARADTYRLLGRLCLAEVDSRLLVALRDTPQFGPTLVGEDAALLAALRVEYTRLLIINVLPYESVFADD